MLAAYTASLEKNSHDKILQELIEGVGKLRPLRHSEDIKQTLSSVRMCISSVIIYAKTQPDVVKSP